MSAPELDAVLAAVHELRADLAERICEVLDQHPYPKPAIARLRDMAPGQAGGIVSVHVARYQDLRVDVEPSHALVLAPVAGCVAVIGRFDERGKPLSATERVDSDGVAVVRWPCASVCVHVEMVGIMVSAAVGRADNPLLGAAAQTVAFPLKEMREWIAGLSSPRLPAQQGGPA